MPINAVSAKHICLASTSNSLLGVMASAAVRRTFCSVGAHRPGLRHTGAILFGRSFVELKGIPARQFTPGWRWQRGGRFANDPDVSELYVELRARGEVEVADRLGHLEVIAALRRRAAEDGLHAQAWIRPAFEPSLVALTRPLEEWDLDLTPVWADAARLYTQATRGGRRQWGIGEGWGRDWPAALGEPNPVSLVSELCRELEWLARANGEHLEVFFDEFNLYIALDSSGEELQPPGRELS
jgi:hypothetical protein